MENKIISIITDITGERVIICKDEFKHIVEEHFELFPAEMILELIERVLKDPTEIYEEKKLSLYHLFYKLENKKYILLIVKKTIHGNYLVTMYPTGKSIRTKHIGLKRIKL